MSENAPKTKEKLVDYEKLVEQSERLLPDAEHAEKLRSGEKDPVQALAEARKEIQETTQSESQLNPIDELQQAENAPQDELPAYEPAQIVISRELMHIRRHLTKGEKRLSKIVHQPVVRRVSEASGKTVARPSGLLGGGALAFIGTTGYFLIAKQQGMRYNYAVFLALFFGGFALGVILELMVWTARGSRRHHHHA